MSAGTITLTNKSAVVSGNGTSFTTEVAAGDFIVVTVGGVPYTLPVKTVTNNTALMLVSNYTGPTQSGTAWSAVPRVALNLVTAALVAQSAEALRGLNYDKQNWQSIFSGTGNVTVKLPDGSTWTGPAWRGIATTLNEKANAGANNDITSISGLTTALGINQGGTGRTDGTVSFAGYTVAGGVYSSYQYKPGKFASAGGTPENAIGGLTYLQCAIANDSSVSDVDLIRRRADGSQIGQIIVSFPKNSGTLATQGTSGRDYKTDIQDADTAEALTRVLSLGLVNFVYKDDEQHRQRFGIIAEEAEKVAPQYIKHNLVPIEGTEVFDDEGDKISEEYRDRPSIDNNPVVMDLLGCVQNLQQQITELKSSMGNSQK